MDLAQCNHKDPVYPAGAQDIFEALTDQRRVCAFTQAPAEIKPEVGSKFTMFGGSIEGTQVALEPGQRIEQAWRFNTWPDGEFSRVRGSLCGRTGCVAVCCGAARCSCSPAFASILHGSFAECAVAFAFSKTQALHALAGIAGVHPSTRLQPRAGCR